jgi:hypothetical protein
MRWRDGLRRLNGLGFNSALIGVSVSWQPVESDRVVVQEIITELEDRRVLYHSGSDENAKYCRDSVQQIREYLKLVLKKEPLRSDLDSDLATTIKSMLSACREFLDATQHLDLDSEPLLFSHGSGTQWRFIGALERLRTTFGMIILKLSVTYQIDLMGELEQILPREPLGDNSGEDIK